MNKIVFRCDGGTLREVGTGHIMRTLTLARSLVRRGYCSASDIVLATQNVGPFAIGYMRLCNQGFRVVAGEMPHNSMEELEFLRDLQARLVVIDRLDTSGFLVDGLKEAGSTVVVFDDLDDGRERADLAINAILGDVPDRPNLLRGYDYLVLASNAIRFKTPSQKVERIVATFGGHDERNLTGFFLGVINEIPSSIHIDLVIAESSDDHVGGLRQRALEMQNGRNGRVTLHRRPTYFLELVRDADLAVVSGGLTVFECADFGIPSLGLPQYQHQLDTIRRLESLGVTRLASRGMDLDPALLIETALHLIDSPEERQAMSAAGHKIVDGRGIDRVTKAMGRLYRASLNKSASP